MDDRDLHLEHDDETAVRDLLQGAARRPELPADELEAITAAARQEWRRTVERVRSAERRSTGGADRRWWAVAAAAALAVAAVLGGWWLLRPGAGSGAEVVARIERVSGTVTLTSADGGDRPLTGGEPLAAGTVVTTGPAARAALVLAGGTGVRLDAGTRLTLAAADRLELGRGAVYVDSGGESGEDGGTGLAVHTALGVARDVGTRFTVRVDEAGGEMVVRVRDGAVVVAAGGGEGRATAGRGLAVGGDGVVRETAVDPWGAGWEWVLEAAPAFPLEGSTVDVFLAWVARETGWTVRYADPDVETAAREIVLHGDPGELRPDRAPAVVLPAAGLESELDDGVLTVRRGG